MVKKKQQQKKVAERFATIFDEIGADKLFQPLPTTHSCACVRQSDERRFGEKVGPTILRSVRFVDRRRANNRLQKVSVSGADNKENCLKR